MAILAQEAAAVFNLGIDPEIFRSWPRWRRKLILLGLALRNKRREEQADRLAG